MKRQKVFGVGFHKTGTKSLGSALETLGYRTCGPMWTKEPAIGDTVLERARSLVPKYDAFQDNPWPLLFREMDADFPDSKFVLTICPSDEWIARCMRFFGTRNTAMRRWIYGDDAGSPIGNEAAYVARYEAHNHEVQAHFAERPDQLLVMPLIAEPRWEPLCAFLGLDVPTGQAFPHKNKNPHGPSNES